MGVLLVITPEYSNSIPGVLKHSIDWSSRPSGDSVSEGKPVAIMGASIETLGTARAQYYWRQVCVLFNTHALKRSEVMIGHAAQRFDAHGQLTDETTQDLIRQLLRNLVDWTRQLRVRTK